MRKVVKKSLCVVLGITLCGCTNQESAQKSLHVETSISKYVDVIDMEYAYDLTYRLSTNSQLHDNVFGFRTSGSDAEHAAADYIVEEMKNIGLQNVEKIPVTVDKWQFNGASLTIDDTDIHITPVSYMVNGTEEDGLEAEIVDCGTGFAEDYVGKDVEGKIALVGVDQYNEAWIDAYVYEADAHGASAIVTYDLDGYGRYSDDEHQIQDACVEDIMPIVCITKNEYNSISQQIKKGHTKATLKIDSKMIQDGGTSYDVVGYIPGVHHDQQIIFAGHYDMYFTGFQDDCSAVATAMSMAKGLIDSGYIPQNDILVVAHGAEEWGATGSEFDWTRGAYELINSVHPEWAQKTLALFNFELSAYDTGDEAFSITCVPEYANLVKILWENEALKESVKEFKNGLNVETYDATTMEDGVSYRAAGVPYFLNTTDTCSATGAQEGEYTWTELHYHTESDNAATYSEKFMKANIGVFGSIAITIDQNPAMYLDFERTCDNLENSIDANYAQEVGIDIEVWNENLKAFRNKAKQLNKKAEDINARYANTPIDEIYNEGKLYNQQILSLFKQVQDAFIGIQFSSDIVVKHEGYLENVKLLDGIIQALNQHDLYNEEETGALDLAYQLNALCEYNYYRFTPAAAQRIDAHADARVQANRWWGNNKGYRFANTHVATTSLLNKENKDDFSEELAIYKRERNKQLKYYGETVRQEIEALTALSQ